jgi:esterase/lipase superfamily enzyme
LLTKTDAFRLLNKDSSVGFGGKSHKIVDRRDPMLFPYLEDYLECPYFCIINASQKDEIRVSTKTPRLFMSYPVEHVFMSTMCLYDFAQQFYANSFLRTGVASAVSDSIQKGCLELYKTELIKRKHLYATDTSAQDSSVHPDFIRAVYARIKEKTVFDNELEKQWFDSCCFNSVNKLISLNGACYMVTGGLGSGDYLTLIINIMWRMYMVIEQYSLTFDVDKYFDHNTTIINGDDLVMSSDYILDLNSKHAKIEWAGKPITLKELDFCSMRFAPYIHHDEDKCRSVLSMRKKKQFLNMPIMELQRLGGIIALCVNKKFHTDVNNRMLAIVKENPNLEPNYWSLYVDYETVFHNYNNRYPNENEF